MTRIEFFEWLDTCPANWNKDGSRAQNNGPIPNFEIINDDFENTTIRFFYDEEMIAEEEK
tara:strand:- start:140 stop:319 length:180 start_codon:yes stop_codon:yes gene_type:complete